MGHVAGDDSSTPSATLPSWLEHLERLHPKTIQLGLDRINAVLERMKLAPEFPIITVGGTNGKGSTCSMLERILTEAGYCVGCYTSPHLLRYNERVRIQCLESTDVEICSAFSEVEAARGDVSLTYFEFGTLAAMHLFSVRNVDVAILEIGLGGRLDAVNSFDPECAVITSVDLDHQDYLGDSRESIGREKAWIYRTGKPAICGDFSPPSSLTEHARNIGTNFRRIGHEFGFEAHGDTWDFWSDAKNGNSLSGLPMPALSGSFQLSNAACALEALAHLRGRLRVEDLHIRKGLENMDLQGRFQIFPGKPTLILDVAHNPHAARGLAENLHRTRTLGKTLAVFAMLADKDIAGVVQAVAPEIDSWFLAGIDQPRGAQAQEIEKVVRPIANNLHIEVLDTVPLALDRACRYAGENDRIIAFGSFYTVADAMRASQLPEQH